MRKIDKKTKAYKIYGKQRKDLSTEELKEYNRILKQESRQRNPPKSTRITKSLICTMFNKKLKELTKEEHALISLYAVLIKKLKGKQATKMIGEILKKEPRFEWLEPPVPNGQITVIDVLKATNKEEHGKIVEEWAGDVFNCWYSKYRDIIENNAETLTKNFETKK